MCVPVTGARAMPRVPPVRNIAIARLDRCGAEAVARPPPVGWNREDPSDVAMRNRARMGADAAKPMADTKVPQMSTPSAARAIRLVRSPRYPIKGWGMEPKTMTTVGSRDA